MPTINQLVRQGRTSAVKKSTADVYKRQDQRHRKQKQQVLTM